MNSDITFDPIIPTAQVKAPLFCRIVFLEDNADDVELILNELSESGMNVEHIRIDKKKEFIDSIRKFEPDIILADYSLASFNGIQAFQMLKEEKLSIPFILVTGVLSEAMALQCLKDGVDDFVLKSNFKRLPQAIMSAMEKKKTEHEKTRIALELKKSHKELRLLLNRHQMTVEEERMNIARDLHDELGQVLTALKIDIMMLWKKMASGKTLEKESMDAEFGEIVNLVDGITRSVKDISAGLRPEMLDELGFLEAVKAYALEFERRCRIKCNTFLPVDDLNLHKNLSIALFRIIQEALTNVARHARATEAEIRLEVIGAKIRMTIGDNGIGITDSEANSSHSLGIIGLRERVRLLNGEFKIGPVGDRGTMVSVIVPIEIEL